MLGVIIDDVEIMVVYDGVVEFKLILCYENGGVLLIMFDEIVVSVFMKVCDMDKLFGFIG